MIHVSEQAHHATGGQRRERQLHIVAPRSPQIAVEDVPVRLTRHLEGTDAKRAAGRDPRQCDAIRVAARIRGEIPRGVLEEPPVQELRPCGVGVPVEVEHVACRELADGKLHTPARDDTRQLIRRAGNGVRFGTAGNRVAEKGARDVRSVSEIRGSLSQHVAVRDTRQPRGVADPAPTRHFHIEIAVEVRTESCTCVEPVGVAERPVSAGGETHGTGVWRPKRGQLLRYHRGLRAEDLGQPAGRSPCCLAEQPTGVQDGANRDEQDCATADSAY